MSLLEQLKQVTVVVADTGDIHSIRKFTPRDATTNPSLITAAAQMPEYQDVVRAALEWARRETPKGALREDIVRLAVDRLAVEFGLRILQIVPGRVSTEVDARLSYDTPKLIEKARFLIKLYEAAGAKRDRILIKLASTWEGIRAAEQLEKEGIHCNLTLLFGVHQAVACAEAGVTLISPCDGGALERKLEPSNAERMQIEKTHIDEKAFAEMHDQDRMAKEKLHEGIDGFTKAQVALEAMLMERQKGDTSHAARELFRIFDLDGDGFISREECAGTDAVFDALDVNGDGRITPEEMGAGLGAAFRLTT